MNYAYVNCQDQATAQQIVGTVNQKMILHSNLLTAKIQHGRASRYSSHPSSHGTMQPSSKDISAVKVLLYEATMTGTDLDDYFKSYGELSSQTIIRKGTPQYAYINFVDPSSAQAARSASPHTINSASVTAVPYKPFRWATPTNPVKNLVSLDFPCDPLAITYVEKELNQDFSQLMIKIVPKSNKLTVHVQEMIADLAKKQVQSTIKTHESKIESVEMPLEFYYLPVLADQVTQKQIFGIRIPFLLKVSCKEEQVCLGKLSEDYSTSKNASLNSPLLTSYLTLCTPPTGKATQYQWYWFGDENYQPYDEELNKRTEKEFKHKGKFVQEIGRFEYTIDTHSMKQINRKTRTARHLKRSPVLASESSCITLQLRAHQDHIQELKREIIDGINSTIQEATIMLPDIATEAIPFVELLLTTARNNFVRATLDKDGMAAIVMRGKNILVKSTEVELHKEILKKEREMEKMSQMSLPSDWEPQVDKCELKSIPRGSLEWNDIQEKMLLPVSKVKIITIERIQNTWLWEAYQQSKKRMSDKNDGVANEKMLFHGTRQTRPKDIYDSEQGFDSRLSSQGLWGEGTYFAVKFEYSDKFAHTSRTGHKQIFLAKVITGIPCECKNGDRGLKVPPKKSDHYKSSRTSSTPKFEGERYDSVSAETNGSKIYIIYELGRVYPAYLITYTGTTN